MAHPLVIRDVGPEGPDIGEPVGRAPAQPCQVVLSGRTMGAGLSRSLRSSRLPCWRSWRLRRRGVDTSRPSGMASSRCTGMRPLTGSRLTPRVRVGPVPGRDRAALQGPLGAHCDYHGRLRPGCLHLDRCGSCSASRPRLLSCPGDLRRFQAQPEPGAPARRPPVPVHRRVRPPRSSTLWNHATYCGDGPIRSSPGRARQWREVTVRSENQKQSAERTVASPAREPDGCLFRWEGRRRTAVRSQTQPPAPCISFLNLGGGRDLSDWHAGGSQRDRRVRPARHPRSSTGHVLTCGLCSPFSSRLSAIFT